MIKKEFNEKNWYLDLLRGPIETKFLSSEFPKEIEVVTWVDTDCSKIDNEYFDISWKIMPANRSHKPGLFIGFIECGRYLESFKDIGEEPDGFCERRMVLTLEKKADSSDKKAHPEFGCWIEITDAKFICWEHDDDDY